MNRLSRADAGGGDRGREPVEDLHRRFSARVERAETRLGRRFAHIELPERSNLIYSEIVGVDPLCRRFLTLTESPGGGDLGSTVTDKEMIARGREAIACFNDPKRRDEYFDLLYDDNVVLHGYTPQPLTPKAGVKAFYAAIFEAFPDAYVETDDMFVSGDKLAWRYRFRGTHRGTFNGIPASGRSFEVPGITILRFGQSRCVERWSVTDFLSMMIQIGAIPPPG